MKRTLAAAAILVATVTGSSAQVINPFEQMFNPGPWNSHASRVVPSRGAPHPDLRCGWWLMKKFGLSDRKLWKAYSWQSVGRPSGPEVGAVGIMKKVTSDTFPGTVLEG